MATSQVADMFWQLPPISRTVAVAAFTTSLATRVGLLSVYRILWHTSYITKFPPEIWRLPSSFLLTGGGMGLLLDPYFLYRYLSELEIGNARFPRREDLVWYLICVSTAIVGLTELAWRYTPLLSGPYYTFLQGLVVAICYTGHQDQRGMKANFWFFTVPAQLVPYCLIVINLLSPDGIAAVPLQITGILVAHLWDFATRLWPEFGGGRNLLPTPGFMSYLVRTPRVLERGFGTAIRPADAAAGSSTGASFGPPLPDSWKSRGSGQRLG